ncbi:hypothetical protein QAD02_008949 [Eretmocerus hayati]|uniref:Uncharacterized protein n=1 Tax=Eretmocerus hayati TaxID=131215 RepID=A0ACC2NAB4_9HYME|nr:hypothetical protein QAD02_008949 [Eretmocerus hayati]
MPDERWQRFVRLYMVSAVVLFTGEGFRVYWSQQREESLKNDSSKDVASEPTLPTLNLPENSELRSEFDQVDASKICENQIECEVKKDECEKKIEEDKIGDETEPWLVLLKGLPIPPIAIASKSVTNREIEMQTSCDRQLKLYIDGLRTGTLWASQS